MLVKGINVWVNLWGKVLTHTTPIFFTQGGGKVKDPLSTIGIMKVSYSEKF